MKKLFILLIVLSYALAGEDHGHGHDHKEEHREEFIKIDDKYIKYLGIKVSKVFKESVEKRLRVPAEVVENPMLSASVSSPIEGIVKKLYVKEGDKVKKDDPIALIYSPEIVDLLAEIEIAKIKLETAEKVYRRDRELYERKFIRYTRFYNSLIEYERAKGIYEALKSKLASYGEIKDGYLLLRSPIDGFVVEQRVIVGSPVDIDTVLFKIHSHEILWVYGYVPYEEAVRLKGGTKGIVNVEGERLPCKIDYIHHEVDKKTRRVRVRCVAKNLNHILRVGAFVTLDINKDSGRKAILIPKRAVQDVEGEKVVFVKKEGGFEVRHIKVGREIDTFYEVIEGLKEGEQIAVEGAVFLKSKYAGVEAAGHAH